MTNKAIRLSAVVITRNEESRIAACLESLSFCDEIIIVDNGSTDKTLEIVQKFQTKIYHLQETDFSALRNIGRTKAKGVWILYVDADEIVTERLQQEIKHMIKDQPLMPDKPIAFFISRENYYLGKKWPVRDRMQRLFLREKLIRWEGKLHETAMVDGVMGVLHEYLIHNTHRSLEEMVDKTNIWSDFEAHLRFNAKHPKIVWWRLLRVMFTGFSRSFIREGGWKAGTVGWIESIYQGFSMFITYAKLWELQEKKSL